MGRKSSEEIMTENFPIWGEDINLQIQEAQLNASRINTRKHCLGTL